MQTKSTSQSGFLNLRALLALVLWATTCLMVAGILFAFPSSQAVVGGSGRTLTFEERVAYQRAIEEVYWRHRMWPKERPDPKPSLDSVMSQGQLEKKVADYLRKSQALGNYWQRPITTEQLQAEMDRMAEHTKQPEVLRELFEALGNDPYIIAQCLARPLLAERLLAHPVADQAKQTSRTFSQMVTANSIYILPAISNAAGGCADDTWTATSVINAPTARLFHTAVWTGSEMIVWGGEDENFVANTGGRYNPATDSWIATNITNAPDAREFHTAVWANTEMVVWGGVGQSSPLSNGGRYDPSTDSWTATSTVNAPSERFDHTAIWTGSEMIVWGGDDFSNLFDSGGRYDPGTNTWTATNITNAPSARSSHTAVWTDSEMIVWGGIDDNVVLLDTGGKYSPSTNSWTATSTANAPIGRNLHTAVWTGNEMIVWGGALLGGNPLNTGGRYNPDIDSWASTSTTNVPSARYRHAAVWSGSEMLIWAGAIDPFFAVTNTGGRYCAQSGPPPTPTPTPRVTPRPRPTPHQRPSPPG